MLEKPPTGGRRKLMWMRSWAVALDDCHKEKAAGVACGLVAVIPSCLLDFAYDLRKLYLRRKDFVILQEVNKILKRRRCFSCRSFQWGQPGAD